MLFVPGNSGSAHQVRSIAAEAARAAARSPSPLLLKFYAVNFNEDLSALDASLLRDQSQFVLKCLRWLESAHASAAPVSKVVIVVGHSMGELLQLVRQHTVCGTPTCVCQKQVAVLTYRVGGTRSQGTAIREGNSEHLAAPWCQGESELCSALQP